MLLENKLVTGQTDDGWTVVQPKSATVSKSITARLAKQVMETIDVPKQDPVPFTKTENFVKQGKTYAAVVMTNIHGRDQNDHVRDCFYDKGS